MEHQRKLHGDGTVAFYKVVKEGVTRKYIRPSVVVGSGFKNPRKAALKWLDEEIGATEAGKRAVPAPEEEEAPPTPTKLPTYKKAQQAIRNMLRDEGWTIKEGLKVPHATSPEGKTRLYFKAQSIYEDTGPPFSLNRARSLVSDPRKPGVIEAWLVEEGWREPEEEGQTLAPYYAAFLKVHPEFKSGGTKANVEFMIWMPKRWAEFHESIGWNPSHRFPDSRQPEFEAWLTQYALDARLLHAAGIKDFGPVTPAPVPASVKAPSLGAGPDVLLKPYGGNRGEKLLADGYNVETDARVALWETGGVEGQRTKYWLITNAQGVILSDIAGGGSYRTKKAAEKEWALVTHKYESELRKPAAPAPAPAGPPFAPPMRWQWNDPTVQNMGYAILTSLDGAKLVMKPLRTGFNVDLLLPTDKGGSSDREYFKIDWSQPSPGSEVAARAYAYMEAKARAYSVPEAPAPEPVSEGWVEGRIPGTREFRDLMLAGSFGAFTSDRASYDTFDYLGQEITLQNRYDGRFGVSIEGLPGTGNIGSYSDAAAAVQAVQREVSPKPEAPAPLGRAPATSASADIIKGLKRGRAAFHEGLQSTPWRDPELREAYTQGPIPTDAYLEGWAKGWHQENIAKPVAGVPMPSDPTGRGEEQPTPSGIPTIPDADREVEKVQAALEAIGDSFLITEVSDLADTIRETREFEDDDERPTEPNEVEEAVERITDLMEDYGIELFEDQGELEDDDPRVITSKKVEALAPDVQAALLHLAAQTTLWPSQQKLVKAAGLLSDPKCQDPEKVRALKALQRAVDLYEQALTDYSTESPEWGEWHRVTAHEVERVSDLAFKEAHDCSIGLLDLPFMPRKRNPVPEEAAAAVEVKVTSDYLLEVGEETASFLENAECEYAAEEVFSAVQSVTPGMSGDEVQELFQEANDAMLECERQAEDRGVDIDRQWQGYYQLVELATRYAAAIEEPEPEVSLTSEDIAQEEELVEETPAPSHNIVGLAEAVVALAHEANRTTLYHFTQLSKTIVTAGAPNLGASFIRMAQTPSALLPLPQGKGRKLGGGAAKAAANTGLEGAFQAQIVTVFATSHPSSVIESANGIIKGFEDAGILSADLGSAMKPFVAQATKSFESDDDVAARSLIFEVALIAAKALAQAGASPTMPAQIIGVDEPTEPASIIAAGPDPAEVLEEAEAAAQDYVAPPDTSAPPAVDTTEEDENPSGQSIMPSQGNLIDLISAVEGNPAKYKPLIAKNYSGYDDEAAMSAAFTVWFNGLITQSNSKFALRWTDAAALTDIRGTTVFDTTHAISAAPDGNQPPNAALWRQVGIPTTILETQERAYIESGGAVNSNYEYEIQFAGASLQGPPQNEAVLTPGANKHPHYYIDTDETGKALITINEDAYQAILGSSAMEVEKDDADVTTVKNGFGAVTLLNFGQVYQLEVVYGWKTADAMTGFLVMLEALKLATCGSGLCVSDFLTEEVEGKGITVEMVNQGAVALREKWKTAFSNTLGDEVKTFSAVQSPQGYLVITMSAGTPDYLTDICVKAKPNAKKIAVKYGVRVRIAGEDQLTVQGVMPYKDFIAGAAVANVVAEKALEAGHVFGVPPKVVTISGDALSSEAFGRIIESFRSKSLEDLKQTVSEGVVKTAPPENPPQKNPSDEFYHARV
jgi:hypothetical protein